MSINTGVSGAFANALGGSAIGSAVVRLALDTRAYDASLAKARGETVAGTDAMGKSTSKFSTVASAAYLIAGIAAIKFAVDSVKAFTAAQEVMAQTEAVLKSTGEAAGYTAQQAEALATSLEHSTTFSDEQVLSAENLLFTFTQIGHDAFPTATQAVLDMSTALGQDLKSSAIQLGKALNDPLTGLTALRRVGVAFSADQVKQIEHLVKQNDLFGAQTIILDELTREFGGSATAAAETYTGQTKQLANAWDDLKEKFGEFLAQAAPPMLEFLNLLVTALDNLQPVMQTLGETVADQTLKWDEWSQNNTVAAASLDAMTEVFSGSKAGIQDLTGGLDDYLRAAGDTATGTGQATGAVAEFGSAVVEAGQQVSNFADLSNKDLKAFRQKTIADFDQIAGGLTGLSRKWELTSEAAVKATSIIADKQQEIADDLKQLDELDLGDGLTQQLLELGPDMVHAFVTGNAGQQDKIREDLKAYDRAYKDTSSSIKGIASKGGKEAGAALDAGAASAIQAGSSSVATAAAAMMRRAVAAAKAAAGIQSPSKVMMGVGKDFIAGLVEGLESEDAEIAKAAQHIADVLTRELTRDLEAAQAQLAKVQASAGSFSSSIASGFSSFLDISGAFPTTTIDPITGESVTTSIDPNTYLTSQLAGAQQFADILNALQAQGASAALLAEIAASGPAAIPFAQSLLQGGPESIAAASATYNQIAALAGGTADALTQDYFGAKIDELKDEIHETNDLLREIAQAEKEQAKNASNGYTDPAQIDSIHEGLVAKSRRSGSLQLT